MTTNASFLINSAHGIYIGQLLAQSYAGYITNKEELQDELADLLAGPDNENYVESWATVTDNAKLIDDKGRECVFYENEGDLWAIPVDELDQLDSEF